MYILNILTFLFIVSSCQQNPTHIDLKGDKYYGWGDENPHKAYTNKRKILPHRIIVSAGQTLREVVNKYHVKIDDVMILNKIKNPSHRFNQSTEIILPSYILHQVDKGDTVYKLGRLYSISPQQIIDINEILPPFHLKIDDIVKIYIERAGKEKIFSSPITPLVKPTHPIKENSQAYQSTPTTPTKLANNAPPKLSKIIDKKVKKESFIWPVRGKIVKMFGKSPQGIKHKGITIELPNKSHVKSIASGKIVYIGDDIPGFGNTIIVKHFDQWYSTYAHHQESFIKIGDIVEKGQVIAQTFDYSPSKLYFSLKKDQQYMNPLKHLKK